MKSHVSMAQHQCPICLVMHDTGEILLKRDLRPTLEPKTLTGSSPCPSCQGRLDNDFIALIETRDANDGRSRAQLDIPRSGNFAFVKQKVFIQVFDVPVPDQRMAFIEPGILDKLRAMTEDGGTELPPTGGQENPA